MGGNRRVFRPQESVPKVAREELGGVDSPKLPGKQGALAPCLPPERKLVGSSGSKGLKPLV